MGIALQACYDQAEDEASRYPDRPRAHYPAGTLANPALAPEERLSWCVVVLPYLEKEDLHKQLDTARGWRAEENRPAVREMVKFFLCPANTHLTADGGLALTHFVGVAGVGRDAAALPAADPKAGFFGYDRTVARRDIKDGTSNTLMVIETSADNGPWAAGGRATVRGLDPDTQPYLGRGRPFGTVHYAPRFAGTAQAPANAALADGSVRTLSESISARTFEALATIAGGDEVGHDF
jgi:Protein of unknown function (DUF1559)